MSATIFGRGFPECVPYTQLADDKWMLLVATAHYLIENVRSMRAKFPCLSRIETVSVPVSNSAIGFGSFNSHT